MDRPAVRWGLSILVILFTIIMHPIRFITAMYRAYKETREQLRRENHG